MPQKEDWSAWYIERKRFTSRDTEGFKKDLAALEAHIKKLQAIGPKDKAGWPLGNSLKVVTQLQQDYIRAKTYILSTTTEV